MLQKMMFVIAIVSIVVTFAALILLIVVTRLSRKAYLKFQKEILSYSQKIETLSGEKIENELEC